jgi:hypothetical protein
MSILNTMTNDLALLINRLDLQATPGTPDMMPLRLSVGNSRSALCTNDASPTKKLAYTKSLLIKGLYASMVLSISSLQPYAAHSRATPEPSAATFLIR